MRIRAAVAREFGQPFSIEELELAAPTGRAVEVRIGACAICHSDITYSDGAWGGDLPAVYGHEAAGEVTAVGPEVTNVAVGDRVIVTLIRSCGTCACCGSGDLVNCLTPSPLSPLSMPDGSPVAQAMQSGAFAEAVVVDQSQVAVVPEEVPVDVASLLACGVITGVGAVVNTAGLRPGQDAVVIGAGGVGLNAIQGARLAGARRIVAVDMLESKLDDALEFGATDGVLASGEAPWRDVKALLGRGADAVFVAVGIAPVYDAAPKYLAPGGRVFAVGMPPVGAHASYEPVLLAYSGQAFVGSPMGDTVLARDIPWLTDLYLQGRLKLDELITKRWTLDQINEAVADTRAGKARRNVIVFD